ncbi:maleylacetate reductase [Corynebacterium sp.]|uniref:maleylacetate reductase n=1 Tax=Corynebacterium sp. TaxID=1720 RepID=UPI003734DD39
MSHTIFTHRFLEQEIYFGTGEAPKHLRRALARLGASRPLLITSERNHQQARNLTEGLTLASVFQDVVMHVPTEVATRARQVARDTEADAVISLGGGSATGLAKAITLTEDLPIVAIPTTYAGSEATATWGMTENRTKTTGSDVKVLPKAVVYDANLLATLPHEMVVASALNALAHCIDSLWAPRADPINRAHALEGARLLRDGLQGFTENQNEVTSRELTLQGCYLAALSFSSAGSGLHHKICHVLGGTFNLPHAETHAVVLPHVLRFNAQASENYAIDRLSEAFGTHDVVAGLEQLYTAINAPRRLSKLGFHETDIPEAVSRILAVAPENNPMPVTEASLTELFHQAM